MDHCRTQGVPVGEEQICGDSVQVGEEVFASAQDGKGLLPQRFHAIAHRMKGKRWQIQQDKHLWQMLFGMPEVVLQMIAMVLQHVEALVLSSSSEYARRPRSWPRSSNYSSTRILLVHHVSGQNGVTMLVPKVRTAGRSTNVLTNTIPL